MRAFGNLSVSARPGDGGRSPGSVMIVDPSSRWLVTGLLSGSPG